MTPRDTLPFEKIGKEFCRYKPISTPSDKQKKTARFIVRHFQERPQQPLCLLVAPWLPHVPWVKNKDFDPSKLKLPEYLADTHATREALAAYYQSIGEADRMLGEVLQALDDGGAGENTKIGRAK